MLYYKQQINRLIINISILVFMFIIFAAPVLVYSAQKVGWEDDFNKGTEGWYDQKTSNTFNCTITPIKTGSIAKIEVVGDSSWGKVATIIENVDLDKYPIVEVKVDQVDVNSAFKIGVASIDWSNYYEIIPGQNLSGTYSGNIKEKTEWSGSPKFNLIIIMEGAKKTCTVDNIRLISLEE